jgi:NAD(P)-dependent dehydrogenase (short-subunit alcohol dehydrogenase family)
VTPVEKQTVLVTGSTDGLGLAAARELAAHGATVLVHGRDQERVEAAVRLVARRSVGGAVKGYVADLSELSQVAALAARVAADNERLDLLVNNAGIGGGPAVKARRENSADGHELRFAVNYLSHFLLTRLLLPLLTASAPARVVSVSSVGQAPLVFDDLMMERGYDPYEAYCRSKLAQVMFTFDLAEELPADRVTANCLHPASLMNTKMVYEWFGRTSSTIQDGLESLLPLAVSPSLDRVSGKYFNEKRQARANAQAYDAAARARLKEISLRLCGRFLGA